MKPLVSIVIPMYNCEEYIDSGLESVFAQTYTHMEVICVDNNSNEATKKKLQEWKEKHPDLIVAEEKKQGAPHARNLGTSLAKGEWIQYFDIDDILLPNKIEHQINLINENSGEVDFIIEGRIVRNLEGKELTFELEEDIWKGMFNGRIGNTMSVLTRKELLEEVGGWDVTLESSQERDLFFRILKKNPRVLRSLEFNNIVIKRENSISTNTEKSDQNTKRYVNLRMQILSYLIENDMESFKVNRDWYLNEIIRSFRLTYKFDKKWTLEQYKKLGKLKFKLEEGKGVSKMYASAFNLFGFKAAESMYGVLGK